MAGDWERRGWRAETTWLLAMVTLAENKRSVPFRLYSQEGVSERAGPLVQEAPLAIRLNGRDLATLLCTPAHLDWLVVGFLYSEGVISSVEEVVLLGLCPDDGTAEVWLEDEKKFPGGPLALTSGCGGGFTYVLQPSGPPLDNPVRVKVAQIQWLMRELLAAAQMYQETGGVHTSALGRSEDLVVVAEDVGRHNAVDKVVGGCLVGGLPTEGAVLLTTGRVSSEMLLKAARACIPVVASLTSPTDRAVRLAEDLGVTLVGYVRGHSLRVYTHPWRVEG